MNHREKNLGIIRRLYPGLAEQLEAGEWAAGNNVPGGTGNGEKTAEGETEEDAGEWNGNEQDILIRAAASGDPTMIIRGIHVHSNRDPRREGQRAADGAGGEGPLVILGFGLGYGAEAAAVKVPERPLIVVERHIPVLRRALECRDLSRLLAPGKVVFVPGGSGEAVTAALELFKDRSQGEGPVFLKNRALTALNENWYAAVERRISVWTARDDINAATLRRFGKRWVRNLAKNMKAIRDIPGVSGLAGLAAAPAGSGPAASAKPGESPVPVFLAAAGPGLDRSGPLLGKIAARCIVVAVDTSLRFVLRHGVSPDFVLVVDPQFWNSRHLDRIAAAGTRLIAESAVYPPVLRHPFRETFLCGSLFPLGRFIEDRVDPKGELGAGGSVATTAWDFARLLGTDTVWIAGLDLAFPGLKTHFKGAVFEERAHTESHRRHPAETFSVKALRDGQPFRGRAADGGPVLTDRRLSLYAAWFENRFRQFPQVRSSRIFPGGLAIRGLESGTVEELLALPERREEILRRLEAAAVRIRETYFDERERESRNRRYEEARNALFAGLETIRDTAAGGLRIAERALKDTGPGENPGGAFDLPQSPAEQERVLKALDKVNGKIVQSEVKEVAGFLFPPSRELEAGLPAEDRPFRRHLEFSARLYRALKEAAEYHLGELR
ncbi:MAG: DUF115 domain-containing protein [Treponema sp.]|jgi:hypothetical protein|nr:DUF115 domain-containing protein [Treponema sp.]